MERDFMGLNSTETLPRVKREITDEDSEVQWPYTRKVSSVSHFMSPHPGTGQTNVVKKVLSDPVSHFSSTPSAGSTDRSQKSSAGEFQHLQSKSDVQMSISNQALSLSMRDPALHDSGSPGRNLVGPTMRKHLSGAPMAISSPASPLVGHTEPWKNPNGSKAPNQMTIFYGGAVNVYDNISPELVHAIMLLARNGHSVASNMDVVHLRPEGKLSDTKPVATGNDGPASEPLSLQHSSNVFSPIAVSPARPSLQYGVVSSSKDEVACNTGMISSPVSKPEPLRASMGPIHMPATSAVPQFRKASLARFLEKRKERVMNVAPYTCEKKPQEGASMDSKRNEDINKISRSMFPATVNGS